MERDRRREAVREAASEAAMQRLLDALTGKEASEATRLSFRRRIEDNVMNDVEVEVEVEDSPSMPMEIPGMGGQRSEEHTSELQSLMRNSYAVFCLKKKNTNRITIYYIKS